MGEENHWLEATVESWESQQDFLGNLFPFSSMVPRERPPTPEAVLSARGVCQKYLDGSGINFNVERTPDQGLELYTKRKTPYSRIEIYVSPKGSAIVTEVTFLGYQNQMPWWNHMVRGLDDLPGLIQWLKEERAKESA